MIFVDLEKAFDWVLREVIKWSMRKLGLEDWLVKVVMTFDVDGITQVRVSGS